MIFLDVAGTNIPWRSTRLHQDLCRAQLERQWLEFEAGCRNVLQLGIIAFVNLGLGVLELIFRPDWEVLQRRVEVKSESPRDHTA